MKGNSKKDNRLTVSEAVLGIVAGAGYIATTSVIETFFYRQIRQAEYLSRHKKDTSGSSKEVSDTTAKEKQRIYSVLSRFKKNGFLEAIDQRWKITEAGVVKLRDLKKENFRKLPPKKYETKKSENVIIVTFDIPESRRRERDWLRKVLSNIGFIMMHRSVWAGSVIMPKDLLGDIKDLGIEHYIQILSVGKISNRFIRS